MPEKPTTLKPWKLWSNVFGLALLFWIYPRLMLLFMYIIAPAWICMCIVIMNLGFLGFGTSPQQPRYLKRNTLLQSPRHAMACPPCHRGINLPATQGSSNSGNFMPGVDHLQIVQFVVSVWGLVSCLRCWIGMQNYFSERPFPGQQKEMTDFMDMGRWIH